MNTYKITFTRENGTQGTDHFTAVNERQARKDFNDCYRHGTGTIISVELIRTDAPATKQQEREALDKVRKIVEQLGPDSYLATTFEGCFDLAAENINNDWACSMADRVRRAEKRAEELEDKLAESVKDGEATHAKMASEIEILKKRLEREQEWRPYEDTDNVQQADYEKLLTAGDTKVMTDDEAKDLLYNWFGFAKEKVQILRSIPTYEVNRHRQLRKAGEQQRAPLYNATDWNYIRFNCGRMSYELYNDELRPYLH